MQQATTDRVEKTQLQAVSSHRRGDIQGLRAVAVLMVLVFHAGLPLPGGFVGVDVFFVISGFVITAMLAREWAATRRIRFGEFYLKRFLRLTPALAAMVATTVVVSAFVLSPLGPQQTTAATAAGSLLLAANWVISATTGGYFDTSAGANPLLNTWSLSVEEQFYVVFPAILALGWILGRRHRRLRYVAVIVVSAVAFVSFFLAMYGPNPEFFGADEWLVGFYSPLSRAWEFAVGALLALALTRFRVSSPAAATAVGFGGVAMLLASLWFINESTTFPGKWTLVPVVGAMCLLLAGSYQSNPVTRALSTRPMVKLGDWSYSIYLWHWPFIVFATILFPGSTTAMVIACLLSLIPAIASYYWIEAPFRRARLLPVRHLVPLVAATLIIPLGLTACFGIAVSNGYWNQQIVSLQTNIDPIVGTPGCFTDNRANLMNPRDCLLNATGAGEPVYLAGDSNALMFTAGLLAASEEAKRPFTSYTFSSCPLVGVVATWRKTGAVYRPGCDEYQKETLAWLEDAEAGTVVLGSADYYLRDPVLGIKVNGTQAKGYAAKTQAYTAGLRQTIQTLQTAGHEVVVVLPIPNFRLESDEASAEAWRGPQSCMNLAFFIDSCAKDMQTSLSVVSDRQAAIWAEITRVAEETGSRVLDLSADICPDGQCAVTRDEVQIYADYNHISTQESRILAPEFAAVLGAAGR
ncbi:acyltransferase [Cryobacterium adonitolivorans]|uniref:Acyltransferase n=1 Tax=Cryobacterium adonitolivorans TaxID=1259189 RepID=A0A4V3IC52_9MICO|nr:acyltransferase family protein [Cryobacterium adonitolivorans]TFB96819.1 acyltransferase [Cryobacterium adonitolivorans]